MKRVIIRGLLVAWILAATLMLSHLWLAHPDIGLVLPKPLSLWLVAVSGSQDGEDLGDLEMAVALAASFAVTALLTWVAWSGWQAIAKPKRR